MDINQFEKEINELFPRVEDGLMEREPEMELSIHLDGCLRCRYKEYLIPCEGVPWDQALDVIIAYIKENK